jgi:hypothetical protein
MMVKNFLLVVLISCTLHSWAQSLAGTSKKKKKANVEEVQDQPSSLQPYYPTRNYEPKEKKGAKKSAGKITYDARERFYERMEQVAKAHRKAEKELEKPQNSDPTYFGHKRPPKKRPPEKMKFCKVCGIRH